MRSREMFLALQEIAPEELIGEQFFIELKHHDGLLKELAVALAKLPTDKADELPCVWRMAVIDLLDVHKKLMEKL